MNYTQVQIANIALFRIGANGVIASITENSPNAIKVLAIWDPIFQEVLAERDWRFAKTRVALTQLTVTPLYGYQFAYTLPSDFLRLVKPHQYESAGRNPAAYHGGGYGGWGGYGGMSRNDPPVWPPGFPYATETIQTINSQGQPQAVKCLVTDYNNASSPLYIAYIQLITDLTMLMPGFVNCLVNRLGAELAIPINEDKQKAALLMQQYRDTLNSAEAQNECSDYEKDEAGSDLWVQAGRL